MFKSVKINNLRAITELEIDNLGRINLFVGQNNCGKTTILEAIFFLVGQTNPQLPINANVFRGLDFLNNEYWCSFFNNMNIDSDIGISSVLCDTQEEQRLIIRPEIQKQIPTKPVSSDVNGDSKPVLVTNGLKLIFTNSQEPNIEKISTIRFEGDKLNISGTKQSSINGIFVSPSTRFDWKVRFGSIQRKKRINELISLLKEIEPNISDIRLNELGILEAEVGLSRLIPINLMGGGIASFLSIALAMLDMQNGIVLIDETEVGLHHSGQEKLWKGVFNWAEKLNVQVFATTHSYECIKAFSTCTKSSLFSDQSRLFRIEREKDTFKSVEFDATDLAISMEKTWEVR
jgi:AAA15 family ATPase/GTPase